MRIDAWMPEYDFSERHRTRIRASAAAVYRTLWEVDLGAHPVARALFAARSLPAILARRARPFERRRSFTLKDAVAGGFVLLEEQAPEECVLGVTGSFWQLSGNRLPTDPREFRDPPPSGAARVAWNFALSPAADGGTLLSTETRIRCSDPASRRAFGRYWLLIRPGSGLLRRILLRLIRLEAERRSA